jgi:hypothetical protein
MPIGELGSYQAESSGVAGRPLKLDPGNTGGGKMKGSYRLLPSASLQPAFLRHFSSKEGKNDSTGISPQRRIDA